MAREWIPNCSVFTTIPKDTPELPTFPPKIPFKKMTLSTKNALKQIIWGYGALGVDSQEDEDGYKDR